jgi:hypothetical protein
MILTLVHHDAQKIALDGTHCDLPYCHWLCNKQGHQAAFREMLSSFCIAFQQGSLNSARLQYSGLFDAPFGQKQLDCPKDGPCELCPQICNCFCIRDVFCLKNGNLCVSDKERLKIIYNRDENFLKSSAVLKVLLHCAHLASVRQQTFYENKMLWAIGFEEADLIMMKFLCEECGCDPSTVRRVMVCSKSLLICTTMI